MLETWIQWTCDGCGETETHPLPNPTKAEVREALRSAGGRSYGRLDYCPRCVKNGNARRRETDMNH